MLEHTRLGIGAVQNGDIASRKPLVKQMTDFIQNPLHLVQIRRRLAYTDRFTGPCTRMQILAQTVRMAASRIWAYER